LSLFFPYQEFSLIGNAYFAFLRAFQALPEGDCKKDLRDTSDKPDSAAEALSDNDLPSIS
jgi:hypothetical protein